MKRFLLAISLSFVGYNYSMDTIKGSSVKEAPLFVAIKVWNDTSIYTLKKFKKDGTIIIQKEVRGSYVSTTPCGEDKLDLFPPEIEAFFRDELKAYERQKCTCVIF